MDNSLQFHTVSEIAEVLRLSVDRVYEAVRVGLLPSVRIGRQIRIEQRAFQEWVAQGGTTNETLAQQAS